MQGEACQRVQRTVCSCFPWPAAASLGFSVKLLHWLRASSLRLGSTSVLAALGVLCSLQLPSLLTLPVFMCCVTVSAANCLASRTDTSVYLHLTACHMISSRTDEANVYACHC